MHDQPAETASGSRLLVDLQTAQGGFFGDRGIRRYATELTLALLRRDAVEAVLFNPNRPNMEPMSSQLRDAAHVEWRTTATLRRLDAHGVGAYLMMSPFERAGPASVLPRYVADSGMRVATVLYDLIPEIFDVYPPELMFGYRVRRELIKQMDLILTLSQHTRRDAIERLGMRPEQVVVIGAAASDFFRRPAPGDQPGLLLAERLPAVTKPFALCVSGWHATKNAEGLIDAWARLPREVRNAHQLVLTCRLPPEAGTAWVDRGRARGLVDGDLIVTNFVDDEALRALYQQARLSVSPSFYEGFGLPVLEAARCGCPAITSNASAVPEVLQWTPASFSPGNLDEMTAVIERGLLDDEFRVQLLHAGDVATRRHTWERVADRTITACTELAATSRGRRVPRCRMALIGSLVPRGRDEGWSTQVVWRLQGQDVHVDCFAASDSSDRTRGHRPFSAFGRTVDPWGYDAIVYLVDEATPTQILDTARCYPGIVWFLAPPAACAAPHELASAARARLVPPGAAADPPSRVAQVDDPAGATASLLELVQTLQ